VQARLDVQEQKEKQELNTPGGEEELARVGGKDAGLPFIAFLDDKGEVIVNDIFPGDEKHKKGSIGHPMEPFEVDWFMVMLHKAAPSMTPEETKTLENYLRTQKK